MFRLTYKRVYEARLAGNIFNCDIPDDDYFIGEPQHAANKFQLIILRLL